MEEHKMASESFFNHQGTKRLVRVWQYELNHVLTQMVVKLISDSKKELLNFRVELILEKIKITVTDR